MKVIDFKTEEDAREFLRTLANDEAKLVTKEGIQKLANEAIGAEYRNIIRAIMLTNLVFLIIGYILGRII